MALRALRHPENTWTDDCWNNWSDEWERWEPNTQQIGFEPAAEAERFALQDGLCPDVSAEQKAHAESWAMAATMPVAGGPVLSSQGVFVVQAMPSEPRPIPPEESEARQQRQAGQESRGMSGQEGVLQREITSVRELLIRDEAAVISCVRKVLNPVLPELPDGVRPDPYEPEQWMRIWEYWGNAGFDVLTLRERNGGIYPLRIEVKRASGSSPRVHLSENERVAAARYLGEDPDGYCLWLVTAPGQPPMDITDDVTNLISGKAATACQQIISSNYEPEGFTFRVRTDSADGSPEGGS